MYSFCFPSPNHKVKYTQSANSKRWLNNAKEGKRDFAIYADLTLAKFFVYGCLRFPPMEMTRAMGALSRAKSMTNTDLEEQAQHIKLRYLEPKWHQGITSKTRWS